MGRLEKLIQQLCPDGVEYRSLEHCCNILDKKRKPVTKAARVSGQYPYYGANGIQDYVADYIFDGTYVLVGEDGSVVTPSGRPVVNWVDGKIWVNNHAHIIEEDKGVLLRYLFHFLQTVNIAPLIHGNIPKLTGGDFRAILIPVPPMEIQREIVRILDQFTELTTELAAELTAELTARKKQYEYYRDELFRTAEDTEVCYLNEISENCDNQRKPVTSGNRTAGKYPYYGASGIVDYVDDYIFDGDYLLISEDGANLLARSTPIAFSISGQNWVNNHAHVLRFDTYETRRYVEIYLNSIDLSPYITGGAQPKLNQKNLNKIPIPLPSPEEQHHIVSILDRFDALCNDLTSGLPAEIEARRKQYEYYRDKLLSFPQISS